MNNGAILVSAFHNKYIKSYPASFLGVFGVRRSLKRNCLKNGGLALDICEGLSVENCFVGNFDKPFYVYQDLKVKIYYSNSFVAPVVTGYIAKYLNKNQDARFPEVLEYLLKNCSKIKGHAPKIEPYIKNVNYTAKKPVISFLSEDENLFYGLLQTFNKSGFLVAALSEKDKDTIPIFHYLNKKEKLNGNLLFTIEYIYDPDVILLCMDKNRMDLPVDWEIIDAFAKTEQLSFCMMLQNETIRFKTVQALFQSLISYFQTNLD